MLSTSPLNYSLAMRTFALLLLTVAVAHASVIVTRTSNDGPHPSTMEIAVALPDSNNNILIPLTRTDAFEDIPITLLDNGVSRTFSSRQVHHPSHSHYRHVNSNSVISVRHVNGKRQVSGHVMHEGTSYFLEPVGESEHRVVKNVAKSVGINAQTDLTKLKTRKRQTLNAQQTTNVAEIHLLLDSTVWSAFTSIYGSEALALTELHFYYTNILNGIDVTYRNMGSPSVSISCIGLTISKNLADDAWMPTDSTNGSAILRKIRDYIVAKAADHYMAFTRIDIVGENSTDVCGLSYVSGACDTKKNYRVSINEDMGMQSWGTAAHELGHNLGSRHDGQENTCEKASKNIMSPSLSFYTLKNVANSYQFSTCSKDYMSAFITSLGSSSCLLSSQGSRVTELTSSEREGARMTLDQVCRLSFPASKGKLYMTTALYENPASICASIYCLKADGSGGTSHGGLRAPVGTPCGSQKSCNWNGECSYDPTAPVADEACYWGDAWSESSCGKWKNAIMKGSTCTSDAKKGCCKTLAGMQQCARV